MKQIVWLGGLLLALGAAGVALGSDPVGAYAVVDRVVLEPGSGAPKRVQLWGTFAVSRPGGGEIYREPQRGYFYYAVVPGKEDVCRREWKDLKRLAGKGEIVGFGSRYSRKGLERLRKAGVKPEDPDPYPLDNGLVRIREDSDYPPIRKLMRVPTPLAPADGCAVAPGPVTLIVRNALARGGSRSYVFEIAEAGGATEMSPFVKAGEKETKWSPRMKVRAGGTYHWRAWVVEGRSTGPAAGSDFRGKARP